MKQPNNYEFYNLLGKLLIDNVLIFIVFTNITTHLHPAWFKCLGDEMKMISKPKVFDRDISTLLRERQWSIFSINTVQNLFWAKRPPINNPFLHQLEML